MNGRALTVALVGLVLLAAAHAVAIRVLATRHVAAVLLAAGPHSPAWMVVTMLGFVLSRVALAAAPGALLALAGWSIISRN